MKFKVHTDFKGSQDGIVVTEFKAGEVVEISEHLAPHIGEWAEPADGAKPAAPTAAAIVPAQAEPAPKAPAKKTGKR